MLPIVLHHGLFGYDELKLGRLRLCYFNGIDRAIAERGHPLIVSRVHPTAAIETRARQLKQRIVEQLESLDRSHDKVVIIAHSLGGLDARYMISKLDMADRVAALLTVTTPHRGSPYADWCVKNIGRRLGGLQLMKLLGLDVQAFVDLTTQSCARFNEQISDAPGVRYFSVGCERPENLVPPFAIHSHRIVTAAEGDNDALVSLRSAQWGRSLGTWPADHWHAINRRLALQKYNSTGDIAPYYLAAMDQVLASL